MLKLATSALMMVALFAPRAHAESAGISALRSYSQNIGQDYYTTSMWFEMLQEVAADCDQHIDRATLMLWNDRMGKGAADKYIVAHFHEGTLNRMAALWNALVQDDKSAACAYAIGQWGQDGDQYPGVLRPL